MREVLHEEIAKERCNAKALGVYNRALKVVSDGFSGGETVRQVYEYYKKRITPAQSRAATENAIRLTYGKSI